MLGLLRDHCASVASSTDGNVSQRPNRVLALASQAKEQELIQSGPFLI
jgi:hypothetical protein